MTEVLLVTAKDDDLASVLKRGIKKAEKDVEPVVHEPTIVISPETKKAVRSLAKAIEELDLPTERRALSTPEQKKILSTLTQVKSVDKLVKDTTAAIKVAAFNHLDISLDDSDEEIPTDSKGYYLRSGEIRVEGEKKRISREVRSPAPYVTAEGLMSLVEQGKISKRDYLKATRKPPRVVNEEGLLDLLKSKPELMDAMSEIIQQDASNVAMYLR